MPSSSPSTSAACSFCEFQRGATDEERAQQSHSDSMWRGAMRGRRYLQNRTESAAGKQKSTDWLYESYYCMSQQHPLIVFLLLIVMGACLALLAVFFASGLDIEDHVAFVITVPTALAIFLTIFVLVCIESVFKKLLRLFSLVIWACLVAMGYLFMFFGGIICPWDQVGQMICPSELLRKLKRRCFLCGL
ncbi:ADCY2 cyclase, partial [Polypterus senegalus]|nr:ADCY2 cyclase [Polypterus senegalus]